MPHNQPVTLKTFTTGPEAHVAAIVLREQGIRSVVTDEATATWFWKYSNAIGGVKLQVAEVNAPLASKILTEAGYYEDGSQRVDEQDQKPDWSCQQCGAEVDGGFEICWSCESPIDQANLDRQAILPKPSPETPYGESELSAPKASQEDIARRAYFASLVGFMVPFLLNFYSFWLIYQLDPSGETVCRRTHRRLGYAIYFNIAALILHSFLFAIEYFTRW